jgi:beta-glucosidase-like glycosyl hydrolase/CubicO group peptidase (beta-lactamase class C family)
MSMRDKVAQLVAVRVPGRFLNRRAAEFKAIESEVRRNHVGGLVLFAGNIYESAILLNELQTGSILPLLVAADFERGASFRITDTTSFPWTMALGAAGSEEFAHQEGAITAREARAIGVHWIYAPVMDVNNNPDNPVINIRSFGEDPELVARLGAAFIRGARENGALTTAKHFPGHGDTATDTHIGLAVVPSDMARLNDVELVPFKSAIKAGVDSIMTAHVAVPQVTGSASVPATLSPRILTGMLRDELRFRGLVVTDAMEMGGITTHYWTGQAAIRALQAGADMLLLPPESDVAIEEVLRGIGRGDLSEKRINESVERILSAKSRLGLQRRRTVDIAQIAVTAAAPESQALAQNIAQRAITAVRDNQHLLPLNPLSPKKLFSLALSSDPDLAPGAVFQSEMRRRFPSLSAAALDTRMAEDLTSSILKRAAEADVIVCAAIVRVVSGRGSIVFPEGQAHLIAQILAMQKPTIFLSFGNPYILRAVPDVGSYLAAFSYADVSQIAAARALAGEFAVDGRMPVSIPGCSKVGDGLQIPKLDMTLAKKSPEALGLPKDAFADTQKLLASYAQQKAFPGASLVVGFRGAVILDTAVGSLDYGASSEKVTGDTIYDLASLSKAIGTTSAAMMLVQSGKLLLDAPVQDYLPEFQGPNKNKVRVRNLLTHTAGFPAFLPIYKEAQGYDSLLRAVFALPLDYEPGSKSIYSDFGMILLGEIVSRASALPLDRYLSQNLFGPLGMKSTLYKPPKTLWPRIAPTENDPWRNRVVRGEVHDENAFAMGGVAGHAGLFSDAHDLAIFAQMMLNRGVYDHRRFFNAEVVARFTSLQEPAEGARGLGWGKPSDSNWTGPLFSAAAYGHTGFTGTSIWIDPRRQLFIILLTNRVHPSRENTQIDEARRTIAESVVKAVGAAEAGSP